VAGRVRSADLYRYRRKLVIAKSLQTLGIFIPLILAWNHYGNYRVWRKVPVDCSRLDYCLKLSLHSSRLMKCWIKPYGGYLSVQGKLDVLTFNDAGFLGCTRNSFNVKHQRPIKSWSVMETLCRSHRIDRCA